MAEIELNKLYNENCLDTMRRMPNDFVDLVVTSPPYDEMRDYKGYSFPFEDIAKELFRVIKPGGVVVWVVGDQTKEGDESGTSFRQALFFKQCGFNLWDTMIYMKDPRYPAKDRYYQCFEYMFIFSKGKVKTFNPIKRKNNFANMSMKVTNREVSGEMKENIATINEESPLYNIWFYYTGMYKSTSYEKAFEHPAIFPEDLAADHINSWSSEEDIVYEPFCGSGTTPVMAQKYRRYWIASEISPEYTKLAQERIDEMGKQMGMFDKPLEAKKFSSWVCPVCKVSTPVGYMCNDGTEHYFVVCDKDGVVRSNEQNQRIQFSVKHGGWIVIGGEQKPIEIQTQPTEQPNQGSDNVGSGPSQTGLFD